MGVSSIEWCNYTFNPWRGCSEVSEACRNCYAKRYSVRQPDKFGTWGPDGKRVVAAESTWKQPLAWNRKAEREGVRRRVFCGSLMDFFEDRPELLLPRARTVELIDATPHLDWLLLTKRPENIATVWPGIEKTRPNVWLGVSVEDQQRADERIPVLLEIPAAVHYVSFEPLLGPIQYEFGPCGAETCSRGDEHRAGTCDCRPGLDWVIVGGETGPNARPMQPDWVRQIRDRCVEAGVAFFFKSWGEWWHEDQFTCDPDLEGLRRIEVFHTPGVFDVYYRVGRDRAGRLLDGREWNEFPKVKGE